MEDLSKYVGKDVEVELGGTCVEGKLIRDSNDSFVLLHDNPVFDGWDELDLQGYDYGWDLDDPQYAKGSIKLLKQETEMEDLEKYANKKVSLKLNHKSTPFGKTVAGLIIKEPNGYYLFHNENSFWDGDPVPKSRNINTDPEYTIYTLINPSDKYDVSEIRLTKQESEMKENDELDEVKTELEVIKKELEKTNIELSEKTKQNHLLFVANGKLKKLNKSMSNVIADLQEFMY